MPAVGKTCSKSPAGLTAPDIIGALEQYSKYDLPGNIRAEVIEQVGRYGRVRLLRRDDVLALESGDEALIAELARHKAVAPLVRAQPDARTLLAKFGLAADHVARPSSSLSPGERTRAILALLQARGTNCLVLDEPTNHLDLPAIEQLEQAVEAFEGTVLLVTHDRELLDAVTTTRTIRVDDGRVTLT